MARPQPNQPPVSFKTVPGRHRTQKWNQAKTYNYDGDDWGGYDPYDDYPAYEEPAPPPPPPQPPHARDGRTRQQSFDRGDERRQFSAGTYAEDWARAGSPGSARCPGSARGSNDGERRNRPRDFTNPEQVPPPLNTRASPGPSGSPAGSYFPPRKSSVTADSPSGLSRGSPALDALPTSAKADKDLPTIPFIRPSDIYKRMEQERERERQSMESAGRPSMDSLMRERDGHDHSPAVSGSGQRPLSAVQESDSPVVDKPKETAVSSPKLPDGFGEPKEKDTSPGPMLPPVHQFSGFGTDFLHGQPQTASGETRTSIPSAQPVQAESHEQMPESLHTTPTTTNALQPENKALVNRRPDELAHQPSQGYKSLVNRAFDRPNTPSNMPSTGSQSGDDIVSRSNTNSTKTSDISPIMSRVPSAATTTQRHQESPQVPTIAEEPSASQRTPRTSLEAHRIPRKPSPGHSRQASADMSPAGSGGSVVTPGYRRSLDPPSHDNSPARTPGLEDTRDRRLSQGLSAETVTAAEAPAVADQGVEMHPMLEPVETPASEGGKVMSKPNVSDSSLREADVADAVNSSPGKVEFAPAEVQRDSQAAFLETHSTDPASPPLGTASGRISPSKGRVREIAGQYQDMHEQSRRQSQASLGSRKSSWSNFRGSEEHLPLKKTATEQSTSVVPEPTSIASLGMRPEIDRELSFQPHLPGGWAATPAEELDNVHPLSLDVNSAQRNQDTASHPPLTLRTDESEVDLTPTTQKFQLHSASSQSPPQSATAFNQAKNAGSALGAALMASVGIGHQTRDFASKADEPAPEVEQPSSRAATGELGHMQRIERPELSRGDTDATDVTDLTAASTESEVPPELPAKDTPPVGVFQREGRLVDPHAGDGPGGRPISNYFSGAVAPLRTGKHSRDASEDTVAPLQYTGEGAGAGLGVPRPTVMPTLSTDTRMSDLESDKLRKEIVRSLDVGQKGDLSRESIVEAQEETEEEDADRTQDALDAPTNMARVERGEAALPSAESQEKRFPRMLDQRFSWETRPEDQGALTSPLTSASSPAAPAPVPAPFVPIHPAPARDLEPNSPDVKPEMPYERPQNRGLHIVNVEAESDEEEENEKTEVKNPESAEDGMAKSLPVGVEGPVSPITKSQENLHKSLERQRLGSGGEAEGLEVVGPSPINEDEDASRIPSHSTQQARRSIEAPTPATPHPPEKDVSSPTSPSGKDKPKPFREILAVKTPTERIRMYDDTRQQFADMNTGLGDWLSGMLLQHPEHANANLASSEYRPAALQSSSGTLFGSRGHKYSPSLGKFKSLGAGAGSSSSPTDRPHQRQASVGGAGMGSAGASGNAGSVDMDKLQQRGKDLMKGAGVLGGKAQAGAKGLFAKGRNRFGTRRESSGGFGGGDKVSSPSTTSNTLNPAAAITTAATTRPPSALPDGLPDPDPNPSTSTSLHPSSSEHSSAIPRGTPEPITHGSSSSRPLSLRRPSLDHHTPTSSSVPSASVSRPLSRTFSRLRARSRSFSRSGSLRSRGSRPASLVLDAAASVGVGGGVVAERAEEGERGGDERVGGPGEAGTGAVRQTEVIAPWAEPEENLDVGERQRTPVGRVGLERDPVVPRLGVLPSPAVDQFSIVGDSPGKVRTAGEVMQDDERPEVQAVVGDQIHEGPDDYSKVEFPPPSQGEVAGPSSLDLAAQTTDQQPAQTSAAYQPQAEEAAGPPPEPNRPRHGRKMSDLATLPSQQRVAGFSPTSPRSPRSPIFSQLEQQQDVGNDDDDDDDLYTGIPMALQARSPISPSGPKTPKSPGSGMPKHAGQEDEGDVSTPTAVEPNLPMSPGSGFVASEKDDADESTPVTIKAKSPTFPGPDEVTPLNTEHRNAGTKTEPLEMATEQHVMAAARDEEEPPTTHTAQVAVAATSTQVDVPSSREVSRPSTAGNWERGSEVSAEDIFEDATEGAHEEGAARELSRHSSVSSMGDRDVVNPRESSQNKSSTILPTTRVPAAGGEEEHPAMTAQAVPAGPVFGPEGPPSAQPNTSLPTSYANAREPFQRSTSLEQRFMNRSYRHRDPQAPRAMSYTPLERNSSGALIPESLNSGAPHTQSVDLSAFSGPPVGTAPYTPHPALRNSAVGGVPPTEYDSIRSPPPNSSMPAPVPRRQSRTEGGDRNSKRFSSFFRGKELPPLPKAEGPPPSAITDQYGLEGIQTGYVDAAIPDSRPQQTKRRSGIWDAFKRSPSVSQGISRESSISRRDVNAGAPVSGGYVARQDSTKPNTLRKVQRSPSNAVQNEVKKKSRFSNLGSLFGRSSTVSHSGEQAKRLKKNQPPTKESSPAPGVQASQSVRGYDAYESMRRHQGSGVQSLPQNQTASVYQTRPSFETAPSLLQEGPPPPPQGWYAPSENQSPQPRLPQLPLPQSSQSLPQSQLHQYRRLHSAGHRREMPTVNVPEAFRPVQASYNSPVEPIGPPEERMHPPPNNEAPRGTVPGQAPPVRQPSGMRQPPYSQRSMSGPHHHRQLSGASGEYQLSPQVSGQSEYRQSGWRSTSMPIVSPMQTNSGPGVSVQGHESRAGSIVAGMARSPAREYADQQTPWSIALPRGGDESQRSSRHSSWGAQGGIVPSTGNGRASGAPQGPQFQPLNQPTISADASMPGRYPHMTSPPLSIARFPMYRDSPMGDIMSTEGVAYPTPPYSPGNQNRPYPPPQRPPPGRYYGHDGPHQMPPPQQSKMPYDPPGGYMPSPYPRQPSGYTGRRDDPTVGEEALDMRGASYPGQEWTPARWD